MRIALGVCAGALWGAVITLMFARFFPDLATGRVVTRATSHTAECLQPLARAVPTTPAGPVSAVPLAAASTVRPPAMAAFASVSSVGAAPAASAAGALVIPVQGVPAQALTDTFREARGRGRVHDAIDIVAPRGTPVLAAHDGIVAKLFQSRPGGITVYEFDPARRFAYYYAHLERYAAGLAEGEPLRRGQVIGYVGSSGNAQGGPPHLHFAIFVLGPDQHWWGGTAIDPYPILEGR